MDLGRTLTVKTPDAWRRWLAKHHASEKEIWLVYYKKASGKSGITYDESVLEGLAYGWIDGLTKSIDDATYACRFTPRRPNSNWSASNIKRIQHLIRENRMAQPGLAVLPPGLADLAIRRATSRKASQSPGTKSRSVSQSHVDRRQAKT
jgi:uncharacterized protein YdeI (YjbR/CyaY-like superfamily)